MSGSPALCRWGLCILCVLLIGALITSYYLQIKRIRAVHETVVSIFAGGPRRSERMPRQLTVLSQGWWSG